jgi:adhesin transport system membrane fusion protein
MSELDKILDRHPLPTWRGFAWPVMLLLASALVWSRLANLEEVAVAAGEVVPEGQVKVIQHLEGGIVQAIHVTDGQRVKAGDPLVQLDLAALGLNREELLVRMDGLLLNRVRLDAEARGSEANFPADLAGRRPELAYSERQAFEARLGEHKSNLSALQEKVRQRELEIQELTSNRQTVTVDLGLARQRFGMSADLLKDGLTSRMEHVQITRDVEALQGRLLAIESQISRAQAALKESRQRAEEAVRKFRREAHDQLSAIEVEIVRLGELLGEATRQAGRTQIASPIDGVVKNLRYHTIGGVVRPGEPIMEIVPMREKLVVEARLNPLDRGYVDEGQSVVVKVSSYDFVRYGGLDGHVTHIAADANSDQNGVPYYRVVIETDKAYLGGAEGLLPIMPGMQATVDIHIGEKSVLEYLVRPVLKLKDEAFRER